MRRINANQKEEILNVYFKMFNVVFKNGARANITRSKMTHVANVC